MEFHKTKMRWKSRKIKGIDVSGQMTHVIVQTEKKAQMGKAFWPNSTIFHISNGSKLGWLMRPIHISISAELSSIKNAKYQCKNIPPHSAITNTNKAKDSSNQNENIFV